MNGRKIEEKIFHGLMITATLIVAGSLVAILATIVVKGFAALNLDMLIKTPQGGYYTGKEGGILNAITGSLLLGVSATALAFCMSVPVVVYLNCYLRKGSRPGIFIRFMLDVLWGIPSIVYGAFGFTFMLFFHIPASLLAGTVTVALLIFPLMSRGMDEFLVMVPFELREASYSIGATRLETAVNVVLRQAFPGMLTAILISFGRGIGDAASVLFTAGFSDNLPTSLLGPVATLPLAIFFQLGTPFPEVQERGYASALILTMIILIISVAARMISHKFNKHVIR
jgi:phosphate transport system permease protein